MEGIQGTPEARERLDAWMDGRRRELRIMWAEVARRAGMSPQNLLRIRKGQISISWDAAAGIESALRWVAGSVEAAVLRGVAPTEITDGGPTAPAAARPHDPEPATWSDLRRELAWWHGRLRDTPEDYQRLLYLLELSAQLEDSPLSTQGGLQIDAQG